MQISADLEIDVSSPAETKHYKYYSTMKKKRQKILKTTEQKTKTLSSVVSWNKGRFIINSSNQSTYYKFL